MCRTVLCPLYRVNNSITPFILNEKQYYTARSWRQDCAASMALSTSELKAGAEASLGCELAAVDASSSGTCAIGSTNCDALALVTFVLCPLYRVKNCIMSFI